MINTETNSKEILITCPTCGRQYLPAEIYYPNSFFGKPYDVDRINGIKIDSYGGTSMNLEEEFECENCQSKFRVTAKVQFKVDVLKKYDMSKAYVTKLFDDRITLSENGAK